MSNQGTTYTQNVYECSRDSATIQIDNTHWINEFSEGIKLNKGDQVRLLGSFVQEGANSNEIEISEDQEVNISYSPYLLGNTLDTIDKSENGNLMDLAQIGDIPYSTDSYGIEPPMRNTSQKGIKTTNPSYYWLNNVLARNFGTAYPNYSGPVTEQLLPPPPADRGGWIGPVEAYENVATTDPIATGETGGDTYGNFRYNPWFINSATQGQNPEYLGGNGVDTFLDTSRKLMKGDSATTWGMNIETDKFNTNPALHNRLARDYSLFKDNDVPTEMYIGHMVKKFILPVLDEFVTYNTDTDPTGATATADSGASAQTHQLEDLLNEIPASGVAGCLAGAPRVGMFISTVDIAQSSGWYDNSGIAYYENKWGTEVAGNNADFAGAEERDELVENRPYPNPAWKFAGACGNTGKPNLKSGVQSVIGEIIAVRAIKKHILGRTQNCYEIYVSNFINPSQIKGTNNITHTFDPTTVSNGTDFAINTESITLYKKCHGSATLENGYNYNPSFNTINGGANEVANKTAERFGTAFRMTGGYAVGQNAGVPMGLSYIANDSYSPDPALQLKYSTGGDSVQPTQKEMGLCNPEGLSFLWNGTHTGYRKTKWTCSNFNRFRANSILEPYRVGIGNLKVKHLIQDIIYKHANQPATGVPTALTASTTFTNEIIQKQQGSVPVCMGAYIICNRDTMMDIARGNLDANDANNFYAQPGRTPRIWMDWGFQAKQSDYTTRHYVGNSWDTTNVVTTNGSEAVPETNLRFPNGNTTNHNELRYGYSWIGRPNNINYRKSQVNTGIPGTTQLQSHEFTSPAYTTYWEANGASLPNLTDLTPIYMSTQNSDPILPNNASQTMRGLPLIWGGYNTCVNSVYFQQKDTGDTKLGLESWRIKSPVMGGGVINTNTIIISSVDTINVDTGLPDVIPIITADTTGDYQIKVIEDNVQYNPIETISDIVNNGNGTYTITLATTIQTGGLTHNSPNWINNITINSDVIIYYKSAGGCGAGVNATPWSADMIMVKESVAKFKVPAGYYTEEQLAEELNNALHYDVKKYKKEYGVKDANNNYSIPTNVGLQQRARTSQPSIFNGMFVQTYIPDISYGFTPITTNNAGTLEQEPQTKDLTTELLTYDPVYDVGTGLFTYYYPEEYLYNPALAYNGTTRRYITDHSTAFPTSVGKHLKLYSVPHTPIIQNSVDQQKELCLIRLRGGALLESDFDGTGTDATYRWLNKSPRMVGNMEMLRATDIAWWDTTTTPPPLHDQENNPNWQSAQAQYMYRTRLTRNLFPNGGSSRVIVGAVDATISWEEGANRFSLNKLYTPLRPHQVENTDNTKSIDFGIDDAVPSAIISAKHTGKLVGSLTGIYINDLNAHAFTQENWGNPNIGDNWLYDIESNETIETTGQALMTILGYDKTQIDAFNNSFNLVTDPFVYKDDILQSGNAIRIGAKITPSINCSNPVASSCLNIAPVQQFYVQVDTDDFFAKSVPLKGSSPYYFIGSNFPSKQFYGNLNGAKLPIIGICSRNFSAFNFVFDLGGSAISYLIDENTTITHIETKIYDSNLKRPTNLSQSSSVIYLITRYNYAKPITDPLAQQEMAQQYIADQQAPMLNEFYSEPTADIRTSLPALIPNKNSPYFTGFGEIVPPMPTIDDTDSDDY
tara:strand:- start:216 stop:5141 length:4926 start_codon:yes stop_codon:yes gene_type:complete